MTAAERAFRRIPGDGWLVLAGSLPELGGVTAGLMERLLAHLDLSRPIAALAAPDCDPEQVNAFLEALEEWLDTEAGYLELETDLETQGWEESGLLLLVGEDPEMWMDTLARDHGERLRRALESGAIVFAVAGACGAFGAGALSLVRPGTLVGGLAWLPDSILLTDPDDLRRPEVTAWLQSDEPRLAIRLDPGSILALGPDQQIERWGDPAPEVVLGTGWAKA